MNTTYLTYLEYIAEEGVDFNTDLNGILSATIKKKLNKYFETNSLSVSYKNGQIMYNGLCFKNPTLFSQFDDRIVLFNFNQQLPDMVTNFSSSKLYQYVLSQSKNSIKEYLKELSERKLPSLLSFDFHNGTTYSCGKDFLTLPNLNDYSKVSALTKDRLRTIMEQLNADSKNVHIYKRFRFELSSQAHLDLQSKKIVLTEYLSNRDIKELITKVQEYVLEYNYFINTNKINRLIQKDMVNKKFIIDLPESKSLKIFIEDAEYFVTDATTAYLKLRIFYGNVKPRFVYIKISNNTAKKITHNQFNKKDYLRKISLTIKHDNNQYILYADED